MSMAQAPFEKVVVKSRGVFPARHCELGSFKESVTQNANLTI